MKALKYMTLVVLLAFSCTKDDSGTIRNNGSNSSGTNGGTSGGTTSGGCPTTANCGCSNKTKAECEASPCCRWVVGEGCKCL